MQDKPISIKITLLGNCGVGKSSIIQRYTSNSFQEDYNSTNGGSYSQKSISIDDTLYQLDIWDTAGQEKYRSLGKNFYKEAYIVILVYDITREDSLEGIKTIWYPDLQQFGEKCKILALVGNKCDRYEEENTVNEEEARAYAKEINANFFIVSAKNGDKIKNLFDKLITLFIEPNFQDKVIQNEIDRKGSVKIAQKKDKEQKSKDKKKKCC